MMMEFDEVYDEAGNLIQQTQREVTPEELTERRRAQTGAALTTEQYAAVRSQMQVLRALRQLGRNAFLALTAAERDREMYNAMMAATEILLVQLRDEP